MFMYSYSYECSVLVVLFHCVVLCTVCVYKCAVLLPPGANTIAVNKYIISYHIIYRIISYRIISYIISYHIPNLRAKVTVADRPTSYPLEWPCAQNF
jgi:hypothetical protein